MTRTFATFVCLTTIAATLIAATPAPAQSYGMAPKPGSVGPETQYVLRVDQKLGQTIPLDLVFYDHDNHPVTLRELIGGKPTLLVPAYYRCPKLCNEVLNGLLTCMRDMRAEDANFTAGQAFNVVTFSIDAREAPALAITKRDHYIHNYDGRKREVPGWSFLTASHGQGTDVKAAEETIHKLTESIGFPFVLKYRGTEYQYRESPETGENQWLSNDNKVMKGDRTSFGNTDDYFHPAAIIVLTPEGKISRYLLDVTFQPRTVRLSLIEASGGKVGTALDQFALLCSSYDETKGHYKPAMRLLGIVAVPFVFLVLGIAAYTLRKVVGNDNYLGLARRKRQ